MSGTKLGARLGMYRKRGLFDQAVMYAIVGLVWAGFASAILYSRTHAHIASDVAVAASVADNAIGDSASTTQ